MKKDRHQMVWHKKTGKMLSSNILQKQQSPKGNEKSLNTSDETCAERFLRQLRLQIKQQACLFSGIILTSIMMTSFFGCTPKKTILPIGKWKRDATYLNGTLTDERSATLNLKKSSFKYEEQRCEMKGLASYQKEVIILAIQESDCQSFKAPQTVYYGYEIAPGDGSLRIFHNNEYNDTIREIYHKVE